MPNTTPTDRQGKRVLVGVPSLTGSVDMRFAYALVETVRLGEKLGATVNVMFRGHDSLIQRVRNDLVRDALDNDYSDLVFIDDDQDWLPEDFFRLLSYPVDCVAAAVRKKTDEAELYNVRAASPDIPVDRATGLLNVEAVGTGFMRLSRQALLAVWNRSEEYRDDAGKLNRWMFEVGPLDGRLVGEDVMLCNKLRDARIHVYVDPTIIVGHTGTKRWDGDFGVWLKRIQAQRAAA